MITTTTSVPAHIIRHVLPDGALTAGIFGAQGTSGVPTLTDCNTAVSGLSKTNSATKNLPDRNWPWGTVLTVSSAGAGADGLRALPATLTEGEVVYQMYFNTKSMLYVRSAVWLTGWSGWVKRWG
ncbi:hypothetical protein ID80_005076 [Salmonella enterica subsp. enterica serovar Ball]|nr:hypothetical protein [Salmonella enterica subsp. salamae]EDV5024342.1 hypothetical protein [Salmonella enterica subsp. enterica serovar Ball]